MVRTRRQLARVPTPLGRLLREHNDQMLRVKEFLGGFEVLLCLVDKACLAQVRRRQNINEAARSLRSGSRSTCLQPG